MSTQASLQTQSGRLHSLDIFRGLTVAAMILVNTPGDWDHIYKPLKHSIWNGCTPTDIIFPAFLFMMGVAVVYAFKKKKADRANLFKLLIPVIRRCVILILLGLLISFLYRPDFTHLRYPGVLQRIGIVYLAVVLLYLNTSLKTMISVTGVILIGYYLIMTLIPLPGGVAPNLEEGTDLTSYIDRAVFSVNHLSRFTKTWDALGLLTTLPAIASGILGVFAGEILKSERKLPETKAMNLFVLGASLTLTGALAELIFPINKSLWTSTYVLYTGGISILGLTLTYWLADLRKKQRYFWPFLVFGTNAITAYVVSECLPKFINFFSVDIKGRTTSGMKIVYVISQNAGFSAINASLISALIFVVLIWLLIYPLYWKKIIIKI